MDLSHENLVELAYAPASKFMDEEWYAAASSALIKAGWMGGWRALLDRRCAVQGVIARRKEAQSDKARELRAHPAAKRHRRLLSVG